MTGPESIRVTFQPIGTRVEVSAGSTVLEAGREAGLVLAANCGGNGLCGRCRVTLLGDHVPEPMAAEFRALSQEELKAGQRLACRVCLEGDTAVYIPATILGDQQRLQLDGKSQRVRIDPCITLHDVDSGERQLGVAVDIGCTKIAAYLLDLQSGEQLAACGIANPQISYGEDLISRLVYAREGRKQAHELARCVRAGINQLIRELLGKLAEPENTGLDQVADMCVVGNTAMTHLFLELPVDGLLAAPFNPSTTSALDVRASDIGIDLSADAHVHVLPAIGAFVGADHVAMILANGLHHCSHVSLAIDIGTNTEIALSIPERGLLLTASCPAGPAFEGGHIHHGMRAAAGAIEKIRLGADGLSIQTIDDCPAVGLCGSGIVDGLAMLWQMGAIDYRGHLQPDTPGVRAGRFGKEFLLVEASDSGHGKDIVITQQDISEVQLAKAAVAASIRTLLAYSNTSAQEIEELVLAGAFGTYLNVENSVRIGLLPHLPAASYLQVGNAAGTGAQMALVSRDMRDQADKISRQAVRVELKQQKGFNRELALATRFPKKQVVIPSEKEQQA